MKTPEAIDIKMRGDTSIISRLLEDGTTFTKRVATDSLCAALGSQAKEYFTLLPEFCRGIYEKGGYTTLLFIYPSRIRHTLLDWDRERSRNSSSRLGEFNNNTPTDDDISSIISGNSHLTSKESIKKRFRAFDIPYPVTIVMSVLFKNNYGSYRLANQYIFAAKNLSANIKDLNLYRYPFTNVYEDDHCCLGNHGNIVVKSLESCSVFPTLVFNGIGNTDLTSGNNLNKNGNLKWGILRDEYELITRLDGEKEFPVEYLKPLQCRLLDRLREVGS